MKGMDRSRRAKLAVLLFAAVVAVELMPSGIAAPPARPVLSVDLDLDPGRLTAALHLSF